MSSESELALPPPNLFPGAVDCGQGRVTFALYAPGKQSVALIGGFNNWNRTADPLWSTPEGLWWTEKHLAPGDYTYQFAVDGDTVICDPYAHALAEDSAYDPPRAIVSVGAQPYRWQHDGWQRPQFNDLVITEIHVNDFSPDGSFAGLTSRLDYLHDLGINAIELMPIFEFKGELGWGYNPGYFFTVEKSYGEPDDLRQLIDEAHGRGIGVILDIVLAHTAHRHPYNKLYPYEESPWYGPGCGEPNQFGFPTLDHSKGPTRDFVKDVQTFWLREFHVDGFRYDYCAGIGCRDGMGVPYMVSSAREVDHTVWLIGEYSPENPKDANQCGLDGAWHVSASYALKALLVEGECGVYNWDDFDHCLEVLEPWQQGYGRASEVVNYLESHDEQRAARDIGDSGFDEQLIQRKCALGATLLYTMPGEPMLYAGQEWGERTPRRTNELNPLHWEQREQDGWREVWEHYRDMAALRRKHPALRAEGFALDATYPEQRSAVYHRWDDAGDEVLVAVNFSPTEQDVRVPFPSPGRWLEAQTDTHLAVSTEEVIHLPRSSAQVFVKQVE